MKCDACGRELVQNEDASWYCPYCGEHYGPWDGADICRHSSCDDCTDCPR
jgi:hypothetical protein